MPCNHNCNQGRTCDCVPTTKTELKNNPLTEAEITEIWMMIAMVHGGTAVEFVREVEKRHNIGA